MLAARAASTDSTTIIGRPDFYFQSIIFLAAIATVQQTVLLNPEAGKAGLFIYQKMPYNGNKMEATV